MGLDIRDISQFKDDFEASINHANIFISGGSSLEYVKQALTDSASDNLYLVDERFDEESNLSDAEPLKVHPVIHDGDTLEQTADRYERVVKDLLDGERENIAVLGMGEDMHIAGILPHRLEYTDVFYDRYVVGYRVDDISDSDNPHRERVTLTFKALGQMDQIFLVVAGKSKKSAIENLINYKRHLDKDEIARHPALFLLGQENVHLYLMQ